MIRCTLILLSVMLLLASCQLLGNEAELPTQQVIAPTLTPSITANPDDNDGQQSIPPTWTLDPRELEAAAFEGGPTLTPFATYTAFPTMTPTPLPTAPPTDTPEATGTPLPTATPNLSGVNILPNPSFEEGWYHVSNYAEVQVPKDWTLGWKEGKNPLDSDPWNIFVRPESRLLNGDFLPADEHDRFIWDGEYTVKVFKGQGALYFWLVTDIFLEPGSYYFEINVFPDLVEGYTASGSKIWASDPLSGEIRFIVDSETGNWFLPKFGEKQDFHYSFGVTEARTVRLGAAFRGRWAIDNNGWFMDDWSLVQLSPSTAEQPGSGNDQ